MGKKVTAVTKINWSENRHLHRHPGYIYYGERGLINITIYETVHRTLLLQSFFPKRIKTTVCKLYARKTFMVFFKSLFKFYSIAS